MPGSGKSSIGGMLAKRLGMNFIDTDILLQENTGRLLQEIINTEGIDSFLTLEERTVVSLKGNNSIIATGGSVVYSDKSMKYLKKDGLIIYLNVGFEEMRRRLNDIPGRGIVSMNGQSLKDIYNQRIPLYEKYADITIDCSNKDVEDIVEKVLIELLKVM